MIVLKLKPNKKVLLAILLAAAIVTSGVAAAYSYYTGYYVGYEVGSYEVPEPIIIGELELPEMVWPGSTFNATFDLTNKNLEGGYPVLIHYHVDWYNTEVATLTIECENYSIQTMQLFGSETVNFASVDQDIHEMHERNIAEIKNGGMILLKGDPIVMAAGPQPYVGCIQEIVNIGPGETLKAIIQITLRSDGRTGIDWNDFFILRGAYEVVVYEDEAKG